MPRPAEEEDGPSHVYRPQGAPAPAYEEFRDPASAHGWLNAYDETRELPRIAPVAPVPPGLGRADRRRAARDTTGRRSKHVAVAVGALGAASVAALIAGFALSPSSSSSDGTQDGRSRTQRTAGEAPAGEPDEVSPSSASAAPVTASAAPVEATSSTLAASRVGDSPSAGAPTPTSASTSPAASRSADGTPAATSTPISPTGSTSSWRPGRGHGRGGGRSH
ncbi:hypothetical protein AB0N16_07855 [Streptomyces sp. NPDC051105]|uniref:hypothetical protein n=1 Tax=Streptomyces sp. NPDC051105 TaxID=3154843 RepID=UPI0034400C99